MSEGLMNSKLSLKKYQGYLKLNVMQHDDKPKEANQISWLHQEKKKKKKDEAVLSDAKRQKKRLIKCT